MDPDSKKKIRKEIVAKEKNFLYEIMSGNLLKNIWTVSYNAVLVALINVAFHFIMSRKLGPEMYGELGVLLSINSILIISLSAICFIIARFVSIYKSRQQYDKMMFLAHWAFIFFFMTGIAGFIITVMISRIMAEFLNIADYYVLIFFGLMVWVSFLLPIVEGILRGLQDFHFMSKYRILEASSKLVISALLVMLGFHIKSVLVGLMIGGLIAVLLTSHKLQKIYVSRPYSFSLKEIYRFSIPVFVSFTFLAILAHIDLVIVKHFFPADISGFYAAAGTLAKTALGIAFGSAGVMFPKIVEEYGNGNLKAVVNTLKNTLRISVIAGILLTLILALYPAQVAHLIFGPQYEIGGMLRIYALAMFFLAIACILMVFDLAVKRYGFIGIFGFASLVLVYQLANYHSTVNSIVWALFVINATLMAYMIFYNRNVLFRKYD